MKKNEPIPEGFVYVTRQIIKDNVYEGDEEVLVWGEKADQQLSLPNDERNPHWRNVKFKKVEQIEMPSYVEGTSFVPGIEEESTGIDIPKKRTRNV